MSQPREEIAFEKQMKSAKCYLHNIKMVFFFAQEIFFMWGNIEQAKSILPLREKRLDQIIGMSWDRVCYYMGTSEIGSPVLRVQWCIQLPWTVQQLVNQFPTLYLSRCAGNYKLTKQLLEEVIICEYLLHVTHLVLWMKNTHSASSIQFLQVNNHVETLVLKNYDNWHKGHQNGGRNNVPSHRLTIFLLEMVNESYYL